ncbi:MAG: hypothetical protein HRF45_01450 [Fimbriimonadia bacterium]|jgi:hypothetical protein
MGELGDTLGPSRFLVAARSEALDNLVGVITSLLDFTLRFHRPPWWSEQWQQARAEVGPSRHAKLLVRFAREIAEIEREMEWQPPPSRIPPSIQCRRGLKLLRFWLAEGIPTECFHPFLVGGLVGFEGRWPEEVSLAVSHWGSERPAAANLIRELMESSRPRTHALHGDWPVPDEALPDPLVDIAQAVTFGVYLGNVPCTARFEAVTESGRVEATLLEMVLEALREGWSAERLAADLAECGVLLRSAQPRRRRHAEKPQA